MGKAKSVDQASAAIRAYHLDRGFAASTDNHIFRQTVTGLKRMAVVVGEPAKKRDPFSPEALERWVKKPPANTSEWIRRRNAAMVAIGF